MKAFSRAADCHGKTAFSTEKSIAGLFMHMLVLTVVGTNGWLRKSKVNSLMESGQLIKPKIFLLLGHMSMSDMDSYMHV